jgi:uncharacterized membrane protein YraQ (UPF0718 family)
MATGSEVAREFPGRLARTLFVVGAGAVFAVALGAFIKPDAVAALKAKVPYPLLVISAELIAFASPEPRYMVYPIVAKLSHLGVDAGIIIALISGHVLIEPAASLMEIGFFGYRFPLKRFLVSLILIFLVAMLTKLLVDCFGWRLI